MFSTNTGKGGRESDSPLPPMPQPQPGGAKRGMFSVIGPDITITGNISATADLHIDGRIDGDVNCGSLVQGTESRIAGSIKADVARLAGTIEGAVCVRQLSIERAARITGDVEYETIAIENGASIDGRLKHVAADAGGRAFDRTAAAPNPEESMRLVSSSGIAAA